MTGAQRRNARQDAIFDGARALKAAQDKWKSPGQLAYEADCDARPRYHDGTRRPYWGDLSDPVRWSWERNPTPRSVPA